MYSFVMIPGDHLCPPSYHLIFPSLKGSMGKIHPPISPPTIYGAHLIPWWMILLNFAYSNERWPRMLASGISS